MFFIKDETKQVDLFLLFNFYLPKSLFVCSVVPTHTRTHSYTHVQTDGRVYTRVCTDTVTRAVCSLWSNKDRCITGRDWSSTGRTGVHEVSCRHYFRGKVLPRSVRPPTTAPCVEGSVTSFPQPRSFTSQDLTFNFSFVGRTEHRVSTPSHLR